MARPTRASSAVTTPPRSQSSERLRLALSSPSRGDWRGLLATRARGAPLPGAPSAKKTSAAGGFFFSRLLPAVVSGPLGGVFADRFDRRKTMVSCDLLRCSLLV